jgi:hypothetical protein
MTDIGSLQLSLAALGAESMFQAGEPLRWRSDGEDYFGSGQIPREATEPRSASVHRQRRPSVETIHLHL